jgi:hypothetical protein
MGGGSGNCRAGNIPSFVPASKTHLFADAAKRYINGMRITQPSRPVTVAGIVLVAMLLAAATGIAFSAWLEKGAAIFMTYAETGLAWCF